ncbi:MULTISPECIES: N-acetylmuramidase domain-containing protein [Bacteroides]
MKGNENILYPKWEKGHYKGGIGEYDRLEQARKIIVKRQTLPPVGVCSG